MNGRSGPLFKSRFKDPLFFVALTAVSVGCGLDAPVPRFEIDVAGLRFVPFSENVGVAPSRDVLDDPNNPFVETPLIGTTQIEEEGSLVTILDKSTLFEINEAGSNVASFYAWATALTGFPDGENQFQAAAALQRMVELGTELDAADIPAARQLAIAGFTNVLVLFPESTSFTATGSEFDLATLAFTGIRDLGGAPPSNWVLVEDASGAEQAVRFTEGAEEEDD